MLFLEFSGTSHGIQCPELSVPDQEQHDPPLSGEAAQVIGLQSLLYDGLLQILLIALFLLGKRSLIIRIEISADGCRDDDVEQAVVKPGQESVPVAAGLDQGTDLFKTIEFSL